MIMVEVIQMIQMGCRIFGATSQDMMVNQILNFPTSKVKVIKKLVPERQ